MREAFEAIWELHTEDKIPLRTAAFVKALQVGGECCVAGLAGWLQQGPAAHATFGKALQARAVAFDPCCRSATAAATSSWPECGADRRCCCFVRLLCCHSVGMPCSTSLSCHPAHGLSSPHACSV